MTRLAQDCYHGSEVPQLTEPSKNHLPRWFFRFRDYIFAYLPVNQEDNKQKKLPRAAFFMSPSGVRDVCDQIHHPSL